MNRHSVKVTVRQEQYANRLMLIISAERLGVKMNDNTMNIMEKHLNTVYENGMMDAQIGMLHSVVDREDIDNASHGYAEGLADIKTEVIRDIFGWELCYEAREVRRRREAEKAEAEQTNERSDG